MESQIPNSRGLFYTPTLFNDDRRISPFGFASSLGRTTFQLITSPQSYSNIHNADADCDDQVVPNVPGFETPSQVSSDTQDYTPRSQTEEVVLVVAHPVSSSEDESSGSDNWRADVQKRRVEQFKKCLFDETVVEQWGESSDDEKPSSENWPAKGQKESFESQMMSEPCDWIDNIS